MTKVWKNFSKQFANLAIFNLHFLYRKIMDCGFKDVVALSINYQPATTKDDNRDVFPYHHRSKKLLKQPHCIFWITPISIAAIVHLPNPFRCATIPFWFR